jgi:hypothetical protein
MGFTRRLDGNKWDLWVHLCSRLMGVRLNNGAYSFVQKLTSLGTFTVKLIITDLMNGHTRFFTNISES